MRAWFVTISLGLALSAGIACGGGSSAEDACEKLCGCLGANAPATCVADCKQGAESQDVTDACFSCIDGSTCEEVFTECNDECQFDGEAAKVSR